MGYLHIRVRRKKIVNDAIFIRMRRNSWHCWADREEINARLFLILNSVFHLWIYLQYNAVAICILCKKNDFRRLNFQHEPSNNIIMIGFFISKSFHKTWLRQPTSHNFAFCGEFVRLKNGLFANNTVGAPSLSFKSAILSNRNARRARFLPVSLSCKYNIIL